MTNKKKYSKKIETDLPFVTATAEQLALIKNIETNIKNLAKQLNSPYSTLISITLIPLLIKMIFLNQKSFMYHYYDEVYLDVYNKYVGSEEFAFMKNNIVSYLHSIVPTHINSEDSVAQFIKKIDEWQSSGKYSELILQLQTAFVNGYNQVIVAKHIPTLPLDSNKLHEYKISELCKLASQIIPDFTKKVAEDFLKVMPKLEQQAVQMHTNSAITNAMEIADQKLNAEITALILPFRIMLIMMVNSYMINPLVMRLFPNGIRQKAMPKRDLQTWFSKKKADNLIKQLTMYEQELQLKATFNIRIARALSVLLLPLALYLLNTEELPSAEMFVFALTLAGTALTNIKNDLFLLYEYLTLDKTLEKQKEKFSSLIPSKTNIRVDTMNCGSLESSSILLSFTKAKLLHIFKNCLVFHQIKDISYNRNTLIIPATTDISHAKTTAIKNSVDQYINREHEIKQLKDQLKKLAEFLNSTLEHQAFFDDKNLPSANFELSFSLSLNNDLAHFKSLFDKNVISVIKNDSTCKILMSGNTPADAKEFETFLTKLRQQRAALNRERSNNYNLSFFDNKETADSKLNASKKTQEDDSAKEIPAENNQATTIVNRQVFWRQHSYNSNSTNPTVFPLNSGRVYDKKFISTCKRFTTNLIRNENFPNDDLYQNVCDLISNSHIVPGKGKSGMVAETGWEKDQDGNWFCYTFKGKFLGHKDGKGDIRIYAEPEINDKGETLYKFKGINFDSH